MWITHVEMWREGYVNVENVDEMCITIVEMWRTYYVDVEMWRGCG